MTRRPYPRESSTARGYGYRWQKYRLAFLRKHPLCKRCMARDRLVVATVVDHIRPHRGDPALFWDMANHQPLCAPCHDRDKQIEEGGGVVGCGDDGWPLPGPGSP